MRLHGSTQPREVEEQAQEQAVMDKYNHLIIVWLKNPVLRGTVLHLRCLVLLCTHCRPVIAVQNNIQTLIEEQQGKSDRRKPRNEVGKVFHQLFLQFKQTFNLKIMIGKKVARGDWSWGDKEQDKTVKLRSRQNQLMMFSTHQHEGLKLPGLMPIEDLHLEAALECNPTRQGRPSPQPTQIILLLIKKKILIIFLTIFSNQQQAM